MGATICAIVVAVIAVIATRDDGTPPAALVPSTTRITAAPNTATPVNSYKGVGQFTPMSASTWWAVASHGRRVIRTDDSGGHWFDVSPPTAYIDSSFFLDADHAWIQARRHVPGVGKPAGLYRTRNGGQSWQLIENGPRCQMQFVDPLHGWCGGADDLRRTVDGGETWTRVSRSYTVDEEAFPPPGTPPTTPGALPAPCEKSLTFTAPTIGWASFLCQIDRPSLYRSTDGGSTWHDVPHIPFPDLPEARRSRPESLGGRAGDGGLFGTPVVNGDNVAVALTVYGEPGATEIATSADGGETWNAELLPDPSDRWAYSLIDPMRWRLTDGARFMATDDAGKHWRTTTPALNVLGQYASLVDVTFLSPELGWITAQNARGRFYSWTSDGGATWKAIVIKAGPYPPLAQPNG